MNVMPNQMNPNVVTADGGGLRYNKGKAPIHLIPPEALFALADHYGRGAEKYKERNWEKGMKWSHCYNSMMRHALSWQTGEDKDPETGTHHMIAAAWNALALFVYTLRGIGEDDRPKLENTTKMATIVYYDEKCKPIVPGSISHWGLKPGPGQP